MKTRIIAIISIVVISSISFTFFMVSNLHEPDTSFYYGGIRLPENDKLCFATLTINNTTITPTELENNIRFQISKLGPMYDIEERRIIAEQIETDIISIEIGGSWRTVDSNERPSLLKLFSSVNGTIDDRLLVTCA